MKSSPHRHLRHGHGVAGGPAQGGRPRRARLRRARLPADVDAAGRAGHPGVEGLRAGEPRLAARRASSSATSAARTTSRCMAAQERGHPADVVPGAASASCSSTASTSVVVAGTHGKTTTSSLLGAHPAPTPAAIRRCLIGGVPLNFRPVAGGSASGAEFVIEGDEYDTAFFDKGSKFLHYRPRTAILTSVEFDHVDIFRDEEAVQGGVPEVRGADPGGRPAARRARPRRARWRSRAAPRCQVDDLRPARARAPTGRSRSRRARRGGRDDAGGRARAASASASLETSLPGIYNVENLVAVIAVGAVAGRRAAGDRARGRGGFPGVRRRQEVRGIAARRHRGRRLRAPPDRDARDAAGAARGATARAS